MGGYTGGAHCCATLQAIVPSAGKLKVIDFEPVDGEPNSLFPRDVDGDGTIDFIRQDDSFRYAFSSGAGSFSPPVIFNIYRGNLINVSDQPAYRQLWLSFAAETFKVCSDRADEDRNGACIAYAAAGARLGEFPTYLNRAVKNSVSGSDVQLPEGCKTELVAYACPSGSEIKFFTFESAANWFLRKNGYIN